jgi:hypothetical protein
MDTAQFQYWTIVLWTATLIAGSATVIIYFCQLLTSIKSIKAQNLAWLVQYLQSTDVRAARFIVLSQLSSKPHNMGWTREEQEHAATACAAYGTAAVFIKLKRVDKKVIMENWGPSIARVAKICEGFINDRRNVSGERYWSALVELNREAIKKFPPNQKPHAADKA